MKYTRWHYFTELHLLVSSWCSATKQSMHHSEKMAFIWPVLCLAFTYVQSSTRSFSFFVNFCEHIAWFFCLVSRPEFGGKYCTGERKRYRICNTKPCVRQQPSFREMQCSEFDTVPYHNELYEWIPVASTCKCSNIHFTKFVSLDKDLFNIFAGFLLLFTTLNILYLQLDSTKITRANIKQLN